MPVNKGEIEDQKGKQKGGVRMDRRRSQTRERASFAGGKQGIEQPTLSLCTFSEAGEATSLKGERRER